jgi:hypothetical protein
MSRAADHTGDVARQAIGSSISVMPRKNTAPVSATGTWPNNIAWSLVVTLVQLTMPVLGQDSDVGSV